MCTTAAQWLHLCFSVCSDKGDGIRKSENWWVFLGCFFFYRKNKETQNASRSTTVASLVWPVLTHSAVMTVYQQALCCLHSPSVPLNQLSRSWNTPEINRFISLILHTPIKAASGKADFIYKQFRNISEIVFMSLSLRESAGGEHKGKKEEEMVREQTDSEMDSGMRGRMTK